MSEEFLTPESIEEALKNSPHLAIEKMLSSAGLKNGLIMEATGRLDYLVCKAVEGWKRDVATLMGDFQQVAMELRHAHARIAELEAEVVRLKGEGSDRA